MLQFLQGKKTYIVAFLFAAFNFAKIMGWITVSDEIISLIDPVLIALGIGSLRAGIKTEVKKTQI